MTLLLFFSTTSVVFCFSLTTNQHQQQPNFSEPNRASSSRGFSVTVSEHIFAKRKDFISRQGQYTHPGEAST
jgi:hypothetical protein